MSKKETRYSLGLPNPDYRHKVYKVDDVIKVIVDLATKNGVVGIIENRLIYEIVTGLQRYSNKRWETLKPVLMIVAMKMEYEVNGIKYLIYPYQPMLHSRFNFYRGNHNPEKMIFGNPVAGFQVSRNKSA